jgi:hypothetical protein
MKGHVQMIPSLLAMLVLFSLAAQAPSPSNGRTAASWLTSAAFQVQRHRL